MAKMRPDVVGELEEELGNLPVVCHCNGWKAEFAVFQRGKCGQRAPKAASGSRPALPAAPTVPAEAKNPEGQLAAEGSSPDDEAEFEAEATTEAAKAAARRRGADEPAAAAEGPVSAAAALTQGGAAAADCGGGGGVLPMLRPTQQARLGWLRWSESGHRKDGVEHGELTYEFEPQIPGVGERFRGLLSNFLVSTPSLIRPPRSEPLALGWPGHGNGFPEPRVHRPGPIIREAEQPPASDDLEPEEVSSTASEHEASAEATGNVPEPVSPPEDDCD
ncbi:MAG: hypothetical protein GY772_30715 [bacterium]|nr:hypothetical protein [bacterium]